MKCAVLVWVLVGSTSAFAKKLPGESVDQMCDRAEAIIEGEHVGKGRVRISRIHKASVKLPEGTKEVEVKGLAEQSRKKAYGIVSGETIETSLVVLFLDRKDDGWISRHTYGEGSCGLFWYDTTSCYGYVQWINEGPYDLIVGSDSSRRIPKNIDALRNDIAAGLVNSETWHKTLKIADPAERAGALARYLIARTAPKGDKGTFQGEARCLLVELKSAALPPLKQLLESAEPADNLDVVIDALSELKAESLAPLLCRVLLMPNQASAAKLRDTLSALGFRVSAFFDRQLLHALKVLPAQRAGEQREMENLMQKLDADDARVRQAASEELKLRGLFAMDVLERASHSSDSVELSARAKHILDELQTWKALGGPSAVNDLRVMAGLLKHPDKTIALAAAERVKALIPQGSPDSKWILDHAAQLAWDAAQVYRLK